MTEALEDALSNAQDELLLRSSKRTGGMGTTMTLAFVAWPHLYTAHVGDGRCYLGRGGELHQLTTDHTVSAVRRQMGAADTRRERALWNALGGHETTLHTEVRHLELMVGDTLTLVTDGVTRSRPNGEFGALLRDGESAEQLCGRLLRGSAPDDRTAIVVRFRPVNPGQLVQGRLPEPPPLPPRSTFRPLPERAGQRRIEQPGFPYRRRA